MAPLSAASRRHAYSSSYAEFNRMAMYCVHVHTTHPSSRTFVHVMSNPSRCPTRGRNPNPGVILILLPVSSMLRWPPTARDGWMDGLMRTNERTTSHRNRKRNRPYQTHTQDGMCGILQAEASTKQQHPAAAAAAPRPDLALHKTPIKRNRPKRENAIGSRVGVTHPPNARTAKGKGQPSPGWLLGAMPCAAHFRFCWGASGCASERASPASAHGSATTTVGASDNYSPARCGISVGMLITTDRVEEQTTPRDCPNSCATWSSSPARPWRSVFSCPALPPSRAGPSSFLL